MLFGVFFDLRVAVRAIRRHLVFTTTVVATLALGLAGTIALLSVCDAIFVRSLPFPRDEQLFVVARKRPQGIVTGASPAVLEYLRDSYRSASAVAATAGLAASSISTRDSSQFARTLRVSAGYFEVLGVRPAIGRGFSGAEERDAIKLAVISDSLWERMFNRNPAALASTIRIDGSPYQVVGVMPAQFRTFPPADAWLLLSRDATRLGRNLTVIGRLTDTVDLARANNEFAQALPEIERRGEHLDDKEVLLLRPYRQQLASAEGNGVLLFTVAVLILLATTVVNTATLLLAWSSSRRNDVTVLIAIGASRAAIVRRMVLESSLFALLGTAVGCFIANVIIRGLVVLQPSWDVWKAQFDGRIALLAVGVGILVGVGCGLLPAVVTTSDLERRSGTTAAVRATGLSRSGGVSRVLIVAEIALSVALLVGAGLLVRTVRALSAVDVGFSADRILATSVPLQGHDHRQDVLNWYQRTQRQLHTLPFVRDVAVVNGLPLERGLNLPVTMATGIAVAVQWRYVSPNFFRVMHIPVVQGNIESISPKSTSCVAFVNRAFANRYQSLHSAVKMYGSDEPCEIVALVGDVKGPTLTADALPTVYRPIASTSDVEFQLTHRFYPAQLVISVSEDTAKVRRAIVSALQSADQTSFGELRPMRDIVTAATNDQRLQMRLWSVLAFVSLLMTALGLYGILAYSVRTRRAEFAVRIALGGTFRRLAFDMLRQTSITAALGLSVGFTLSILVGRVLKTTLFGVHEYDVSVAGTVIGIVALVTFASTSLPLTYLRQIDPVDALRAE